MLGVVDRDNSPRLEGLKGVQGVSTEVLIVLRGAPRLASRSTAAHCNSNLEHPFFVG